MKKIFKKLRGKWEIARQRHMRNRIKEYWVAWELRRSQSIERCIESERKSGSEKIRRRKWDNLLSQIKGHGCRCLMWEILLKMTAGQRQQQTHPNRTKRTHETKSPKDFELSKTHRDTQLCENWMMCWFRARCKFAWHSFSSLNRYRNDIFIVFEICFHHF